MTNETKRELLLVTVAGPDRPGITTKLMEIIKLGESCDIIDMGQSVTHGLLSLSFVLDFGRVEKSSLSHSSVVKELLFAAKGLGQTLDFQVIEENDSLIAQAEQAEKFVVSCVSQEGLKASFLQEITSKLAVQQINIQRIDNISQRRFTSVDLSTVAPSKLDWPELKKELIQISDYHGVDIAFLKNNVFRHNKRLIAFDMDSTLIQTEVIDEMAEIAGVGEKVKSITARAMNGELDYKQSLIERVKLLKGLPQKELQAIQDKLPLTEGVEDFVATVRSLGFKLAIISGGFDIFANYLKTRLGMDYAFANELEIKNGELTGNVVGTIVDPTQKAFLLGLLAQQEGISLEQVVAVGDGANDLPMLAKAGMGIAFHAKDVVKNSAEQSMAHGPMTSLLYFLGIPGPQIF